MLAHIEKLVLLESKLPLIIVPFLLVCHFFSLFLSLFLHLGRRRSATEMGMLDHILDFCDATVVKRKHRKPLQTVEIKVKMDCDGCERRVRNSVIHIKGVKSVDVNRKQSKVTVTGNVEPNRVLNKVKSTGKRAEFWPYVPYNVVSYPYAAQVYDKKAPSGYVKNAPQAFATTSDATQEKYIQMFSDENPNASCSIM